MQLMYITLRVPYLHVTILCIDSDSIYLHRQSKNVDILTTRTNRSLHNPLNTVQNSSSQPLVPHRDNTLQEREILKIWHDKITVVSEIQY